MTINPVGVKFFRTDGRTDKYEEDNSYFTISRAYLKMFTIQ